MPTSNSGSGLYLLSSLFTTLDAHNLEAMIHRKKHDQDQVMRLGIRQLKFLAETARTISARCHEHPGITPEKSMNQYRMVWEVSELYLRRLIRRDATASDSSTLPEDTKTVMHRCMRDAIFMGDLKRVEYMCDNYTYLKQRRIIQSYCDRVIKPLFDRRSDEESRREVPKGEARKFQVILDFCKILQEDQPSMTLLVAGAPLPVSAAALTPPAPPIPRQPQQGQKHQGGKGRAHEPLFVYSNTKV